MQLVRHLGPEKGRRQSTLLYYLLFPRRGSPGTRWSIPWVAVCPLHLRLLFSPKDGRAPSQPHFPSPA